MLMCNDEAISLAETGPMTAAEHTAVREEQYLMAACESSKRSLPIAPKSTPSVHNYPLCFEPIVVPAITAVEEFIEMDAFKTYQKLKSVYERKGGLSNLVKRSCVHMA